MNKSYISPTKLSCLALVCMISTLTSGFDSMILCVTACASFVFGIAIVSNLEKVASNHVRFIIYTLIVSAIFTVVKLVFGYVKSLELLEIAEKLDWAMLSAITLSIMPIYFMHKDSTTDYYLKTILTACIFAFSGILIATIIEFINFGTIFGLFVFNSTASVLGSPFMAFVMLAIICVIGTATENHYIEKRRADRVIIDRYKYMIREHMLKKYRMEAEQKNNSVKANNDANKTEGGNE